MEKFKYSGGDKKMTNKECFNNLGSYFFIQKTNLVAPEKPNIT